MTEQINIYLIHASNSGRDDSEMILDANKVEEQVF